MRYLIGDTVLVNQVATRDYTRGWRTGIVVERGEVSKTLLLEHPDETRSVVFVKDVLGRVDAP